MNITGYVTKNKSTFAESPFNEADSLVLSQLSYLSFGRKYAQYPKVALSELSAHGNDLVRGTFYPKSNVKLLHALAKSSRFAEVKVGFFRQRNSVKRVFRFAAVTFLLPNGDSYIAFRGTDTTLCGWKEDFYMSFLDKIPSHTLAKDYLNDIADKLGGRLFTGGHSKGGNLAVYASVHAAPSVRDRIILVYNHDGPGFKDSIYDTDEYLRVASRIRKTVPRDSLVGVLLNTAQDYEVVDCNSLLLLQHNPFTWNVSSDGHFKKISATSYSSRVFDAALTDWIYGMDTATRRKLVRAIFTVLEGCGLTDVTEIAGKLVPSMRGMYRAYKQLDEEGKELMSHGGKQLVKLWFGTVFSKRAKRSG